MHAPGQTTSSDDSTGVHVKCKPVPWSGAFASNAGGVSQATLDFRVLGMLVLVRCFALEHGSPLQYEFLQTS